MTTKILVGFGVERFTADFVDSHILRWFCTICYFSYSHIPVGVSSKNAVYPQNCHFDTENDDSPVDFSGILFSGKPTPTNLRVVQVNIFSSGWLWGKIPYLARRILFFILFFTLYTYSSHSYKLVGGLEHFLFFHILVIIIPPDFHIVQRGSSATNQQITYKNIHQMLLILRLIVSTYASVRTLTSNGFLRESEEDKMPCTSPIFRHTHIHWWLNTYKTAGEDLEYPTLHDFFPNA